MNKRAYVGLALAAGVLMYYAVDEPNTRWSSAFSALRGFLFVLLLFKTADAIRGALTTAVPWSRVALPAFLAIEIVLVASHAVPRSIGILSFAALDVALLTVAIWTVYQVRKTIRADHAEELLTVAFNRFFPNYFSRIASVEITIIASAFRAFHYIWQNNVYDAASYVECAKIRLLVLAMPVMLLPDLFFVHFVLPQSWIPAKIMLDILGVYSCTWVLGLFATMASRPHELGGPTIRLYRGILNTAVISKGSIEQIDELGPQRGFIKRGASCDEAHLIVGGVPAVRISLKQPASVSGLLTRQPRMVHRIVIATDRPQDLASKLRSPTSSAAGLSI